MAPAGVVVFVLALPLAVASVGRPADDGSAAVRGRTRPDDRPRTPGSRSSPPRPGPGPGLTMTARCGPELSSPDGVEAQTCVLTRDGETWARTYYRNATGDALSSALTLMGPGGRTVQRDCAVGAEDDPGVCETPGERTAGDPGAYSAVAEFARSAGSDGPLLLRSGSNSVHR
ncbi:hypothetical protein ACFCYX_08850 [Streptomyces populi]|uniref:hypothetical protein n=1 Tax=Streptomyces populi TaxID=2058924 RepID=UPI0013A6A829|nr:hypothetical protein [Streptomyces populi]